MRLACAAAVFAAGLLSQAASVCANEQAIEHLAPPEEQRIEMLSGGEEEQRVHVIGGDAEQVVGEHVPPTPSEKTASRVGQFMLGVASAGVALGVMAASLLLL